MPPRLCNGRNAIRWEDSKAVTMCSLDIPEQSSSHTHWLGSHFTFSFHFEVQQLVSSRTVTGCKHLTALSLQQQQQQLQPPHPHTQVQLESQPHSVHSSFHQSVYQCKNNCHWHGCTGPPLILATPPTESKTKAFIRTCMSVTGIHLQSKQFIPPQWQSSSPPVSLPGSQWRLTGQLPAATISAS